VVVGVDGARPEGGEAVFQEHGGVWEAKAGRSVRITSAGDIQLGCISRIFRFIETRFFVQT
jgi:hypothetical protein